MTDTLTYTIFKSNKISFETKDDDYRYVKSVNNIKKRRDIINRTLLYSEEPRYNSKNG